MGGVAYCMHQPVVLNELCGMEGGGRREGEGEGGREEGERTGRKEGGTGGREEKGREKGVREHRRRCLATA